jgi:hypothetical protein
MAGDLIGSGLTSTVALAGLSRGLNRFGKFGKLAQGGIALTAGTMAGIRDYNETKNLGSAFFNGATTAGAVMLGGHLMTKGWGLGKTLAVTASADAGLSGIGRVGSNAFTGRPLEEGVGDTMLLSSVFSSVGTLAVRPKSGHAPAASSEAATSGAPPASTSRTSPETPAAPAEPTAPAAPAEPTAPAATSTTTPPAPSAEGGSTTTAQYASNDITALNRLPPINFNQKPEQIFHTSKGSTYVLFQDGTTQRYKVPHQGHSSKDVGWKEPSAKTVFVAPSLAEEIGGMINLNEQRQRIVLDSKTNQLLHLSWSETNDDWGRNQLRNTNTFSEVPKIGLSPLELWAPDQKGYYQDFHAGNEISSLKALSETSTPPTPPPASGATSPETRPAPAATSTPPWKAGPSTPAATAAEAAPSPTTPPAPSASMDDIFTFPRLEDPMLEHVLTNPNRPELALVKDMSPTSAEAIQAQLRLLQKQKATGRLEFEFPPEDGNQLWGPSLTIETMADGTFKMPKGAALVELPDGKVHYTHDDAFGNWGPPKNMQGYIDRENITVTNYRYGLGALPPGSTVKVFSQNPNRPNYNDPIIITIP